MLILALLALSFLYSGCTQLAPLPAESSDAGEPAVPVETISEISESVMPDAEDASEPLLEESVTVTIDPEPQEEETVEAEVAIWGLLAVPDVLMNLSLSVSAKIICQPEPLLPFEIIPS